MPTLTDPRAEAFAQSRARGANLEDAYELAGFAGGQGHASRFARRAKVAARIRQPITGQDIALELQKLVQKLRGFRLAPAYARNPRDSGGITQSANGIGARAFDRARKDASNKPENRPNKPKTAHFRPDFAARTGLRRVDTGDRPQSRPPSARLTPSRFPLMGQMKKGGGGSD
jgi:hypothetical protein